MLDWERLKVGDKIQMHIDEFDTVKPHDIDLVVTDVACDHAIARGDGMSMWIDEDTQDLFKEVEQ